MRNTRCVSSTGRRRSCRSLPSVSPGSSQRCGTSYLTMAYLEGKPMSDYLAGGKLLPQRHAALIVRKLALALEEAHALGVVHRDLKPSNIMINLRGEPIITDFGLAWRADRKNT